MLREEGNILFMWTGKHLTNKAASVYANESNNVLHFTDYMLIHQDGLHYVIEIN